MKTLMACPARYFAENIQRGANIQGTAAALGTTLHAALEDFIAGFKLRKDIGWSIERLLELYDKAFKKYFSTDFSCAEYKDGKQILVNWFYRDSTFEMIVASQTLSVETKKNFPIKVRTNTGVVEIPFTYIFDRLDKLGPGEYRVVDYKSSKFALNIDDLKDNIQARAYAVAVATQFKDAEKIWVVFDFLRHESIGVVFTREDNIATYRLIQEEAAKLINFNEETETPKETLNAECLFCIRKATCKTLQSNVLVGGIMGLSIDESIDTLYRIRGQLRGLETLANDLEKRLILHSAEVMDDVFVTEHSRARIWSGSRRRVDQEKIAAIVGSAVMSQYNNVIRVADLDSLFNHPDLTPGQKAAIKGAVSKIPGSPSVKVSAR